MNWVDLPIVFWFYSCSVLSSYAMLSFHEFFFYIMRYFSTRCAMLIHMIFFVHTDVLCRLSCSMSLTVLHTWHVVLKHFPCLCKMAFLFVFIMERGGVEYLFINEALGCIAFCMLFWCIIWVLAFYQIELNDVLTCTPTFLSIYIDCYEVECMYME